MKKLLNTIYVTSEGAVLRKDGETLSAEIDGAEKIRIPLHMLASVVCYGPTLVSPALIGACAAAGITVALLDRAGRFQARIEGPVSGNVLLRRAQHRAAEPGAPVGIDIARSVVMGKIANQRAVLRRALRDHGADSPPEARDALENAVARLAAILRRAQFKDASIDTLRGSEGEAAGRYFAVFGHLVRSPDEGLAWTGRSRRPPLDPLNALLSFLYTLLVHDCRSACEAVGLDPAVGFLHRDRPGRPSLALDLMEELRAPLADRLALSLINRRQLRDGDFRRMDGGAVLLSDEARRLVLTTWQERRKEERRHPFLDERAPFGLVPHLQAQLLSRRLRGDLDAYPPWFWS
ncbi:MAG: type I-C CRISPR-associated endonuclease Cas1c [Pseudomonadota bacterium]|nr:type I-C CRISPR-associated endonuclease Cas1c [Pseudomonadota bacterium]